MPNTKPAVALDAMPDPQELLAARAAGLSLVAYRERKAGALPPDERNEDRLEKAEQLECWKVFRAFGGRVYSLSQSRASKQTPGLGDGFVIFPQIVSFWWESKRQKGGKVSPAQQEFHVLCHRVQSGSAHFFGGRREAEEMVIALGIATRGEDGSLYPVRRS